MIKWYKDGRVGFDSGQKHWIHSINDDIFLANYAWHHDLPETNVFNRIGTKCKEVPCCEHDSCLCWGEDFLNCCGLLLGNGPIYYNPIIHVWTIWFFSFTRNKQYVVWNNDRYQVGNYLPRQGQLHTLIGWSISLFRHLIYWLHVIYRCNKYHPNYYKSYIIMVWYTMGYMMRGYIN